MTEAIKLEPCDIREHWDVVRAGLEEIKSAWPESNTWRPEDVYAEVVNDNAVLYMVDDGFAICTLETDRWTGTSDLFIWIAYSHKPGGMLGKYWKSFIGIAEHLGCKGIQTGSLHPALESWGVMKKLYTTYRYELDESTAEKKRDS
jgi:hypothetical protein